MIASIAFRNFKALRNTAVALAPFNLIIGPNGSGKTSLIEAITRLRTLSRLESEPGDGKEPRPGGPEIEFRLASPHEGVTVRLGCVADARCDTLRFEPAEAAGRAGLRDALGSIRAYSLEREAMARPSALGDGAELAADGGNLGAVLWRLRERTPEAFAGLTAELLRILPEFQALELTAEAGRVEFALMLTEDGLVRADELSQGMLYLLGVLALAFEPEPPRVLCIEEVDRGVHPRTLREVRDALYRLSYPKAFGLERRPTQIVATSHSPYFIDLFRDHPEEIVIADKHGREGRFARLCDRADLPELLREGSLGEMWFSGILGGVPEER